MTSQRTLGQSGIRVPSVGIGGNAFGTRFEAARVVGIVDAAIEHDVAFFDTSDYYGNGASEEALGAAVRGRRDQVVIATKFGVRTFDDGRQELCATPEYVRLAVEASLGRLGTDYIDLYQIHIPNRDTPIAETLGALHELVLAGKVRAIGCSNMQSWEVVDAAWTAMDAGITPFATAQNEYSMYNRTAEVELVPACEAFGVGILPYFPLAYGLLTGKYSEGQKAPEGTRLAGKKYDGKLEGTDWPRVHALEEYARKHDISMLQLAIGGLAAQPCVSSVIAGVTSPAQVAANAAAGSWVPTSEQFEELNQIGQPTMSHTTFGNPTA